MMQTRLRSRSDFYEIENLLRTLGEQVRCDFAGSLISENAAHLFAVV